VSREDGFRDPGLCDNCHSAPCLCANAEHLRQQYDARPVVIHILKHGRSYCDMPGVPGSWPPKHQWISFEDAWQKEATCQACRVLAARNPESLEPLTLADIWQRETGRQSMNNPQEAMRSWTDFAKEPPPIGALVAIRWHHNTPDGISVMRVKQLSTNVMHGALWIRLPEPPR
jgi:hypothetical protein